MDNRIVNDILRQKQLDEDLAKARDNFAKRDAEIARREAVLQAEREASLEPEKERRRREWLIDHPGETAFTFDTKVWPLMKQALMSTYRERQIEAEVAAQRARYRG